MGLEYVNRHGDRYFLLQGKTKTGKPKYYASMKTGENAAAEMPEGYEFYEQPQGGLVTVRKIQSTRILPLERMQIEAWTRKLAGIVHFIIEIKGDSLIVHTPGNDIESEAREWAAEGIGKSLATIRERLAKRANYAAMFRFKLSDEDERLFDAERWCFRGSIDGWLPLSGGGQSLETLARKYLPHLAKESFFDLMM
jgi:hypothetical protein